MRPVFQLLLDRGNASRWINKWKLITYQSFEIGYFSAGQKPKATSDREKLKSPTTRHSLSQRKSISDGPPNFENQGGIKNRIAIGFTNHTLPISQTVIFKMQLSSLNGLHQQMNTVQGSFGKTDCA
jgi:hypothetical protein